MVGTLKSCAAEIGEIRFDRKFRIETLETMSDRTNGRSAGNHSADNLRYQPTKIRTLRKIFAELHINYEDFIFLDLGSGKGRALLIASEFPFRRIIGVEISTELHSIAQKNIRTYQNSTQKCSAIDSLCCDAALYPMPPENMVLFLFNPFTGPTLARILANLSESLRNHPSDVYLVYNNPVCHDLIANSGFLGAVSVTELYAIYKNKKPASAAAGAELTVPLPTQ
jgi:SAM-dependent methyltransferase